VSENIRFSEHFNMNYFKVTIALFHNASCLPDQQTNTQTPKQIK